MKAHLSILTAGVLLQCAPVLASGDFPGPSCRSWNGTIVSKDYLDTSHAAALGKLTLADVEEYCHRDTDVNYNGDPKTFRSCVKETVRSAKTYSLSAKADCKKHEIWYQSESETRHEHLPVDSTVCASGNGSLVNAFRMLCPREARRFKLSRDD